MLYVIILLFIGVSLDGLVGGHVPVVSYFDEMAVALMTAFIVLRRPREDVRTIYLLTAGLLSYELFLIPLNNLRLLPAVIQSVVNVKFFIVVLFFSQIPLPEVRRTMLSRSVRYYLGAVVVFLLVDLLFRESYHQWFGLDQSYRFGVLRSTSLFAHPGNLGDVGGALVAYGLTRYQFEGRNVEAARRRKSLQLIVLGTIFIAAALVRKPIVGTLAVAAVLFARDSMRHAWRLAGVLAAAGVLVTAFSSGFLQKEYNLTVESVQSEHYIRRVQYFTAAEIAADYFPFGSGPGTFLSKMSVTGRVSPIYYRYGTTLGILPSQLQSTRTEKGSALYDNNLAAYLGELGVAGIVIVLMLHVLIARALLRRGRRLMAWIGFSALIFVVAIASATSVYVSGFEGILFGAMVGLGLNPDALSWGQYISTRRLGSITEGAAAGGEVAEGGNGQ